MSLVLAFKIANHLSPHLNPHPVVHVEHVMPGLRLPPLIPTMSLHHLLHPPDHPGGGPCPPGVEPRHTSLVVLGVELVYPAVEFRQDVRVVYVAMGDGPIIWQPDHLGGVQHGGHGELVGETRVDMVLVGHIMPERFDFLHNRIKIPTFEKIV